MALVNTKTGDAIAAYVQSVKPPAGAPVTSDQLKAIWEGVMGILYGDIETDADIVLMAGDITIPGVGLNSPVGPVTGDAVNAPGTVSGRIK